MTTRAKRDERETTEKKRPKHERSRSRHRISVSFRRVFVRTGLERRREKNKKTPRVARIARAFSFGPAT